MPKNKVNSPVLFYNESHLSLKTSVTPVRCKRVTEKTEAFNESCGLLYVS